MLRKDAFSDSEKVAQTEHVAVRLGHADVALPSNRPMAGGEGPAKRTLRPGASLASCGEVVLPGTLRLAALGSGPWNRSRAGRREVPC